MLRVSNNRNPEDIEEINRLRDQPRGKRMPMKSINNRITVDLLAVPLFRSLRVVSPKEGQGPAHDGNGIRREPGISFTLQLPSCLGNLLISDVSIIIDLMLSVHIMLLSLIISVITCVSIIFFLTVSLCIHNIYPRAGIMYEPTGMVIIIRANRRWVTLCILGL